MANPNPQHNPTDGLNVAAYVQITASSERYPGNLENPANGGTTVANEAFALDTTGLNGQGIGAVASTNHPVAQYQLQLSLSTKTIGGRVYHSAANLIAVLKDVANTTYTGRVGTAVWKSYGNPSASGAWYRPSVFTDATSTSPVYHTDVASVDQTGLVAAIATGQCIVEVQFPVFDDVMSPETDNDTGNPTMMIYAQVIVNVVA
jgi:hypothetical protein